MPNTEHFAQSLGLLLVYSAAVVIASVLGGILPEWIRLTHTRMQLMISFVGGVMLGIAVFHMIPHALVTLSANQVNQVMWGVMLGLLATFFLLRCFHFHQHEPADFGILADEHKSGSLTPLTHLCSVHGHPADVPPAAAPAAIQPGGKGSTGQHGADGRAAGMRWIAVLMGLGLHTLMDGVALASGIAADLKHGHVHLLPGLGIFLAVLLHKPLDAVSITSLMHPVTTRRKRMLVNIGFALMCPLGAFLLWGGTQLDNSWSASLAGWGLAFSAGVFLCISLSDLLPEMEFHSHSRIPLSIALLAGILAAWAIGWLEGAGAHHRHSPAADDPAHHVEQPHSTDSHDHPH